MSNEYTDETNGTGKPEPDNLWPEDFGTISVVPPVTILRQQAAMLGQVTQNLLVGEVKTSEAPTSDLIHRFYVVAPALGNYQYQLFQVTHSPIAMYPAKVTFGGKAEEATSEAALRNILKRRFAADQTRQIVQSLVAQSMATATT